jgi:SAM-dependent methyltransferase
MSDKSRSGEPLDQMNPTGRFSDRASDYVKYRPGYPDPAISAILQGLEPAPALQAADVGAGTGISSRALADRGVRVVAIEPNAAMHAAAEPHSRVTWQTGTAEATGLPSGCADLVVCAQAFHWMRQHEAVLEFRRVLKPGGRLALMWNERDRSDPLMTAYRDAIRAVGGEHPAEMREFDPAVVTGTKHFMALGDCIELSNSQRLDEAGLIGRAMSASYVPKTGDGAMQLTALLRQLYSRFREPDGRVTLRYITRLWLYQSR